MAKLAEAFTTRGIGVVRFNFLYTEKKKGPPDRMPEFIRDADIVLDQFSLGTYGVLAVEAMAAARIVVGHVAERVRARFGEELPIVESRREDLRRVLTTLLEDREQHRRVAARGPQLVREYHDGTRAADVLADIDMLVDMVHMEETLMAEGVKKFADPQKALLKLIADKRAALKVPGSPR